MPENLNIPNSITFARGLLIIPFVYFLLAQNISYSLVLFIVFFTLDVFDGKVAKLLNQETNFGNGFDFAVDGIAYMIAATVLTLQGKIPISFILLGIGCIGIKTFVISYQYKINHILIHHKYDKFEGLFAFILIILFMVHTETTIFLAYIILIFIYISLGYYSVEIKRRNRKSRESLK